MEAKAAAETKGDGARWEEEEEDGGAASRRGTGIVVGIHGQGSPPPPPFSGLARCPRLGGWADSRGVKQVTSSVKQRPARVVLVKRN